LVFATVVAGLIPLAIGGVTIVTALAGVFLMSHHVNTSQYTINIVTLIGLGVSIDYSLFIVSRFKEELEKNSRAGDAVAKSIETAVGTAGKTTTFSGLAVAIGLSALLFYQGTFLSSMGLAGSIVVAAAIFYALTTLPALLSILGPKVNRLRMPLPKQNFQQRFWSSLSNWVMRHPWLTLIPATSLLLAAAFPILSMRIANADITALPPNAESRKGIEILRNDFVGQNLTDIPVVVHFNSPNPLTKDNIDYLYDLNNQLLSIKSVYAVSGPFNINHSYTKQDYERLLSNLNQLPKEAKASLNQIVGQDIVVLNIQTAYAGTSDETRSIVKHVRDLQSPQNGEILATGFTANDIDFLNYIYHQSVYTVAFIIIATILSIFAMLRSIILPIKAVLMNLLSISASFGMLTFIFQQGHLSQFLNFTPQSIDPSIPVLLFCIVFGLSMDYEVLLLSRMREEYQATRDNRQAVALGLQKSAVLITGAGLIMISVFAAFGTADVVIIKAIGLGMAIAVLVDMTIVRALIVPALMRVIGRLNWWPAT
jgi:RND superfamily putative drug exporter